MDFLKRLIGRDQHTQRMKALFAIERYRSQIDQILSKGIIDKGFDDERHQLTRMLNEFTARLKDAVSYSDWWTDWEDRLKEAKAARRAVAEYKSSTRG